MTRLQRVMRWLFGRCYFPDCDCRIELDEPMKCMKIPRGDSSRG